MRLKQVIVFTVSLVALFHLSSSPCRCQEENHISDATQAEEDAMARLADLPLPLTLEKVIDYVAHNNPTVEEARLETMSKYRQSRASWGDFEPSVNLSGGRTGLRRQNNTLEALQQNFNPTFNELNNEYSAGLGGRFFSGTGYNFGYNIKRLQNSLTTGKQYESFVGLTAEQPLLKNFLYGSPTASLNITHKDYMIARDQFRKQLMQAVLDAETAYWNLAMAKEQARLADESLEIAEKLYADSKAKSQAGTVSDLDLTQAKAERDQRLALQAQAKTKLLDASMQLKLILSDPSITGSRMLDAIDPLTAEPVQEVVADQKERLIEQQPDLQMRRNEVDKEDIRLSYYKSQRLPELNLKGNYGWSGLGSNEDQSWEQVKSANWPAWSLMLEVKLPLFAGIRERNELAAAKLNKKIAEQRLKATDYELTRSLASIERRLEELKKEIDSMTAAVECKQLVLEMAVSRFDVGKTDMRFVYDSEEDVYDARRQQLESLFRYRQGWLQLQYLKGTLLVNKGLEKVEKNVIVSHEDFTGDV
ncbi:MAG: TolC family protein [Deltaproteobacteria bacterium]